MTMSETDAGTLIYDELAAKYEVSPFGADPLPVPSFGLEDKL